MHWYPSLRWDEIENLPMVLYARLVAGLPRG